jgi:hypothetical protein
MSSSTRISDLPDTISVSKSRNELSAMGSGTYIPIDVHENPYNNGKPQPEDMPFSHRRT